MANAIWSAYHQLVYSYDQYRGHKGKLIAAFKHDDSISQEIMMGVSPVVTGPAGVSNALSHTSSSPNPLEQFMSDHQIPTTVITIDATHTNQPVVIRSTAHDTLLIERIHIRVPPQSTAVCVYESNAHDSHGVRLIECTVGAGAHCTFVYRDEFSMHSRDMVFMRVMSDAESQSSFFTHNTGRIQSDTVGEYRIAERAAITVRSLVTAQQMEQKWIYVNQYHEGEQSRSDCLVRSITRDGGQCTVTGLVSIDQKARKTHAMQYNKNLILTAGSAVAARPALHIHNHDVICTHGSTSGPLDEEVMWYLLSRGIAFDVAQQLVQDAFVSDVMLIDVIY